MLPLLVRSQAQLDIAESAAWSDDQKPGLGVRFLDEVARVLSRAQRSPRQFPEIDPGIRRGLLQRFPYSIYFSAGSEWIEVIAVLHQHRHPDSWRR